jgi:hypothetical protein
MPMHLEGGIQRFSRQEVLEWMRRDGEWVPTRGRAVERSAAVRAVGPPPLVAASADPAIDVLLDVLARDGIVLGRTGVDESVGVEFLGRDEVLLTRWAGDSLPVLEEGGPVRRIHVCHRSVGLVATDPGRFPELRTMGAHGLAVPTDVRTRRYLERAAWSAGLDPAQVLGNACLLGEQVQVCAAVVTGQVRVGLAARVHATRLGLAYRPLVVEPVGLLVQASRVDDPRVILLVEALRGRAFHEALDGLDGYEAAQSGRLDQE